MDIASTGIGTKWEPKRMVGLAFVAFGLLAAALLNKAIGALFDLLSWNKQQLFGEDLTVVTLIAVVVSAGAAIGAYMHPRVRAGGLDIAAELKKVTWPSFGETRVSTVAVIIASLVSATILFLFDFISSKVMTEWLPVVLGWLARL